MFLAHAPLSFLANEFFQRKRILKLTQNEKIFVGLFALLAGILPDVDIFILQILDLPTFIHHQIISHTLFFYIVLWIILKLLFVLLYKIFNKKTARFLNKEFLNVLLDTLLIGTITHILADFLVGEIMILYPFSTQRYTVFGSLFEPNLSAGYFYSISFGIEVAICVIFFSYLFIKIFKKSLFRRILDIFAIILCILFLGSSAYASFYTYRESSLKDSNGQKDYDLDKDLIADDMDMDVDNDGIDNILDVDIKELVNQVNTIISSSKWTVYGENSTISSFKTRYGGLTSYRLISQAYFNLHSPITPVLRNQAIINKEIDDYTDNLSELKALHTYFKSKNLLSQLTSEQTIFANGTIFFISDDHDEILNVGIVTGSDAVGIVLPYDKVTRTHTFSDITNYYGNSIAVEFTK